jgi:hypothetical protein
MTILEETSLPMRIYFLSTGALGLTVPEEMLTAAGFKPGDYIRWKGEEDGSLSLTKAEGAGQYVTKILDFGEKNGIVIPITLVMQHKVEKGMFGIWRFGKGTLFLELAHEEPDITRISVTEDETKKGLSVRLPHSAEGYFRGADEAILEVKEGKLYVRRQN